MSTIRPTVVCMIACALLAAAIVTPTATARPVDQEQSPSTWGTPPAVDAGTAAAEAQEQYYQSYGPPAPQDDPSAGVPWTPIVLPAIAVGLAAIVVSTTLHRRRQHAGRSRARVAV